MVEKEKIKSTIDQNPLKGECLDGSILNGFREPKHYNLSLDQPPQLKVLCDHEMKHYKKTNKYWLI